MIALILIALAAQPTSRPAPDLSRVSDLRGYAVGLWNQIEGYKQKIAGLESKVKELKETIAKQNESYIELSRRWDALPEERQRQAAENLKTEAAAKSKSAAVAGSGKIEIGMTLAQLIKSLDYTSSPHLNNESAGGYKEYWFFINPDGISHTCTQLSATFQNDKLIRYNKSTYYY